MKPRIRKIFIIAGISALLSFILTSCGGGGYGSGGAAMIPSTVQVVACPVSGTTDISIVNMVTGYTPSTVSVPVNTTVKWTNNDAILHTVTSTTVPLYGNFDVSVGAAASVCLKFTSAGSFSYHCSIHPLMPGGSITVTP